ncbi:MAG: response regulator [Deltaproteobacteria bacterium]|nr:response regulator [Deltaproteobacteria bacterium]
MSSSFDGSGKTENKASDAADGGRAESVSESVTSVNGTPSGGGSGGALVQSLTSTAKLFIFAYSPRARSLITWSDNAPSILGVKDTTIARDANLFLRHVHDDDRFLLLTDLEEALKGGREYRATYRWIRPDNNELRWLHCRAAITQRDEESLFEGIILDLTDEFTGEIAHIAGPDSIATLMAAFPTMVFTLDRDMRILRLNCPDNMREFTFGDQQFHRENFKIGRTFLDCFKDGSKRRHYEEFLKEISSGASQYHRERIVSMELVYCLEIFPLLQRGTIEGFLFVVSEISELVNLERELAQLHKTEGLRLLAAGVSHNFNNSMQSIIGHATIIRNHPNNAQLALDSAQAIIDIVNRTSELSRQLFISEESSKNLLVPVDLNLAAMSAANRVEGLFSSSLKIAVAFGTPAPVVATQDKLVTAIEALIKNARESMPQGGTLSIKTYQAYISENEVAGLKSGSYAKLAISDSGSGMSEAVKERCFEPFFTTKDKDPHTGVSLSGSGLGLSQAYAILRELNGMLTVESLPGFGTTVSVYLPSKDDSEDAERRSSLFSIEPGSAPDVLIVDDDLMVLQTAKTILEDAGLTCVVAEDSTRALSIMNKFRRELQLVIVDAVMPGMDGATLLRRIKRINHSIVALGFTGAPSESLQKLLDAGAVQVLKKPVDSDTLKSTVCQALQSQQAA